jgi:hypothetical protein
MAQMETKESVTQRRAFGCDCTSYGLILLSSWICMLIILEEENVLDVIIIHLPYEVALTELPWLRVG